ncbi:amidase family protein [Sphingomonas sp.]|uniref:amidase family protein n=1 Tax=Sphingomonas sp. TaxID=28214 RepID=UPI003AFFC236
MKSALATAAAVRAGAITAAQVCDETIARIEARDGALNAVVVRDFDRARAAAAALDARIAEGFDAPLLGVAMTVKESFDIAGLPTTWGFAEHADHIAQADALAVERLKAAGAIIVGKTNVPVSLADLQSNNPVYGRTLNPHHPERSAGGSSGGGAVALASGMVPLEYGSDIGGSIRVPAAFNGVWGHKPTFDALSKEGHFFPRTDAARGALSVIGPMARDADDLALALDLVSDVTLPRDGERAAGDWRVLVLDHHPAADVQASIRAALGGLASALATAGATVTHASDALPDLTAQHRHYMTMLNWTIMRGRAQGEHPAPTLAQWFDVEDEQARCIRQWKRLFATVDAVIAPTLGTVAFPHDDAPIAERRLDIDGTDTAFGAQFAFPGLATFPLLPATSVPIGRDADGLPIGVQIITDAYRDHRAIDLARLVHRLTIGASA